MKDKSIIINQLMTKNVISDNFIKFKMPQTWNHVKAHPNERVLSFLCSIINTHIGIFIRQVEFMECLISHNCGKFLLGQFNRTSIVI